MSKNIYCGSSCVKYVVSNKRIKNKIKNNMLWVPELSLSLVECGMQNIKVYCYNSNLYSDYKNGMVDLSFDGFKYLSLAEEKGIIVEEKELDKDVLKNEIQLSDYIIMCVESKVFNDDSEMTGGHYIILKDIINDKIKVINPIKDKYEELYVDADFILRSCKNYGSWRILIKEEK